MQRLLPILPLLTPAEKRTLIALGYQTLGMGRNRVGLRIEQLCAAVHVKPATAYRVLTSLARQGYIGRERVTGRIVLWLLDVETIPTASPHG